jgi:hypothetical protein
VGVTHKYARVHARVARMSRERVSGKFWDFGAFQVNRLIRFGFFSPKFFPSELGILGFGGTRL